MRKKMKKPFAYLLVLFLLMSSVCNRGIFVLADSVDPSQQDSSIVVEETKEKTAESSFTSGQTEETTASSAQNEPVANVSQESDVTSDDWETTGEGTIPGTVTVEYLPVSQPSGIQVKAYAEKGVLPEGTVMTVTELEEGSAEHSAAEEALEQSTVNYDGFKALDISFYDAAGSVIEPQDGSVQVRIEMNTALLPEKVNTDSLAVQHLDESTGEIEVQTVATAAVGTVETNEAAVTAEFSVESFSTFTITWTNGWSGTWQETYFEITVHCVNTNGEEIEAPRSDLSLRNGTTIEFSKYAPTASGLKYKEARYNNPTSGQVITSLNAESTTEGEWYNRKNYNVVTFVNGSNDVASLKYETTWGVDDETKKADVYLVYETDVVTPPSPETVRSLTKSKTAVSNGDGTYDLNLEVSGAVGSINNKAKIDVLLIIDKSGSMEYGMNSNSDAYKPNRRIDAVADAVEELTNVFDENSKNIDVRYSAVTFSNNSKSKVITDWTSSGTTLNTAVGKINPNGGTNYQKGISLGKTQLEKKRSDAEVVVIFLSDGLPTTRGLENNNEGGNGQDDNGGYNIQAAVEEIKGLSSNQFYCIGIGPDFTSTSGSSTARNNLNSLCSNAGTASGATKPSKTQVYTVSSLSDLTKAFKEIAGNATSILCDHVSITDILRENVEVSLNTEGQPSKLLVTVTNADGNTVKIPAASVSLDKTDNNEAATITASYENRQLNLDFPESYKLEPGWTYKLTATIQASETAYEEYRRNGLNYPDFADANTGTHSSSEGFYSNDSATVSYTYNGENRNDTYDHPVIQLHPGTLVIEKTIEGLDGADLGTLVDQLAFEVTINGTKSTVGLSGFTRDLSVTDKAKYVYRLEGLSPNTTYSVAEKNAELEAYDLTSSKANETGTIAKDTTKTASFTNSYTPSDRNLTINKTVSGNMGEKDRAFTFTLKLSKDQTAYTETIKDSQDNSYTAVNGVYSFELKHGESVTFIIPYGCEYEIEENTPEDYTMTATEGSLSGTITEDTEVTVNNDRTIASPTGIFRNIFPFIMMVVVAVDAAIVFFVMYMRRKRY